jgi:hypothetical protein
MTGAVCPACGVAVVPGYVRCPKCHRPLPRFARNSTSPVGGTTLEKRVGAPMLVVTGAVVVGFAILVYFAARGDHHAPAAVADAAVVTAPARTDPVAALPPIDPIAPSPAHQGPSPETLAGQLQHTLQHARLWSTVTVVGDRVDVRSSACSDPAMKPALDAAADSFKTAGLARLRCVEESGSVVIDRDL